MDGTSARESIISSQNAAVMGGCHEISFPRTEDCDDDIPLLVAYTLPSGVIKTTRGFATGGDLLKARCYVCEEGTWKWEARNLTGRGIGSGAFRADASPLPGKLRVSKRDPRQLQYDSGKWYLNFGDNAQRFLSPDESRWKAYVDQAAQAGFNRIRSNLYTLSPHLLKSDGKGLELNAWDAIEERLLYALQRHPEIQFELTLFDGPSSLARFHDGELIAHHAFRYALERFAPLPNIHWNISSPLAAEDSDAVAAAKTVGKSLYETDPWNSLVTLATKRFESPLISEEKWHSLLSFRSLGQTTGESLLSERRKIDKPLALAEDRGERHLPARFPRYYFRRLFWGAILSGSQPSYRGLNTDKPYDRNSSGIEGYYDACNAGHLQFGAHDLLYIKKFFADTQASLEGWKPNDALSGGDPLLVKSIISSDATQCIAYLANPESFGAHSPNGYDGMYSDQISDVSSTYTTFTLDLPFASGTVEWFDPTTGEWNGKAEITKSSTTLLTPTPGDWVVWVKRS